MGAEIVLVRKRGCSIVLVLLLLSLLIVLPMEEMESFHKTSKSSLPSEMYAPETITIGSDSEFAVVVASMGFPGNGTEGNPYVIADLDINYILIEDTTVYFEIRRCNLDPIGDPRSIDLNDVTHGLVDSCIIANRPNGIKTRNSQDIVISNNILTSLSVGSISVYYSSDCNITDNDISGGGTGIGCYDSDHIIIDRNLVTGCNWDGINFYNPQYSNITNNQIIDCDAGFRVSNGLNLHVHNNTFVNTSVHFGSLDSTMLFSNNTVNGLELGVFMFEHNLILNGNHYGQILLYSCSNTLIANGTFGTLSYGIEMTSCTNCTVENLTFLESHCGIWMIDSLSCTISNSSISGDWFPIFADNSDSLSITNCTIESDESPVVLLESKDCTVVNNTFTQSYITFKPYLDVYSYYNYAIDFYVHNIRNNTIDGLFLGYFLNQTNVDLDLEDYGQIIIVNSTGFSLGPSTITNRTIQVHSFYSHDIQMTDCDILSYGLSVILLIESNDCSLIDCHLAGTNLWLHHSKNFTLLRNIIQSETDSGYTFIYGAYLYDCDASTISGNSLFGPMLEGLQIYSSDNITVTENVLERPYFGLIVDASNSLVAHNHISEGENNGLMLVRSTNTTVEYNDCHVNSLTGRGYGLVVDDCVNCTVSSNSAVWSIGNGLRLSDSIGCTISSNVLERNSGTGMYIGFSSNCTIVSNSIQRNTEDGIRIGHSSNNTLFLNRIGLNHDGNALDDGSNNTWDNGVVGNYWDDYIGSGIYDISGTAQSVDRFPMKLMIEDGVPPILSHPNDVTYEFGTTGHSILWHATDEYPNTYQIEVNGTIVESGVWESYWISIDIDEHDLGFYNYTLTIYDEGELWTSDTVFVMVIPPASPTSSDFLSILLIIVGGSMGTCAIIVLFWYRYKR